jgi:hypothetical protein
MDNKMALEPKKNSTEAQMAWDDLRTSQAFPAIVGGLAGAGISLGVMLIYSQLNKPKKPLPAAYDADGNPMNVVYLPPPKQFRVLGFTLGDMITLGTIGLALFRQIQDMQMIKKKEQEADVAEEQKQVLEAKTGETAPPAEHMPSAQKKK